MSEPKYSKGQKITIIRATDAQGKVKYPSLDGHVGKAGKIVDSTRYTIKPSPGAADQRNKYLYMYIVDTGEESVVGIFEEMLQPVAN